MPGKPDLYAALLQEYYRLEESILAEAATGLSAAGSPEGGRAVLELAISQLRAFLLKALQSQALRLSEIEEALRQTGESLAAAQQRMEGMERENAEASALLFKMKVRGESQPQAAEAQELADRVIEQEKQLQKREGEVASLRKRFQEAQTEREALLRRLEAEESRAVAPEPAAPVPPDPAIAELKARLLAAEAARQKEETQSQQHLAQLREVESVRDGLARRLREAESAAQHKDAERATLAQRLAKVEPEAVAEVQRLGGLLAESQAMAKQKEAERAALASRLDQAEADLTVLRRQAAAPPTAPPRAASEVPALRARLAELERRLAEPGAEVAALRRQLQEEETFRAGFIQRIQTLEAAHYRAQEEAKLATKKLAAAEKVPWAQERAGLLGRVEALQKELGRLRAVHEDSQREWTETLSRQDALRLNEIAQLKHELEKHRPRQA